MWAASCLSSCCAACACEACRSAVGSIGRRSARIAYCGLFGLSLIVSWILREIAAPLLESIPYSNFLIRGSFEGINHFHKTPDWEWFETDAVLRVNLGNFLFFTILAVLMMGIKNQKDPRDRLHHGGWMAKIFCWCVIVFVMFFVPNEVVSFYEPSKNRARQRDEDDNIDFEDDLTSQKRARVSWTLKLYEKFINAINQLGIDRAVPKIILDIMEIPGLTRQNVASHLQFQY